MHAVNILVQVNCDNLVAVIDMAALNASIDQVLTSWGSRLHVYDGETGAKEGHEVILSQANRDGLPQIWGIAENACLPHAVYGWCGD